MRKKEDIALAATAARSYNRHWRAKKLSWGAIGKIRYLFDGAIEYMAPVTLAYPQENFNKLRTALGFKQDSELVDLIEQSDAFRIVRNKDTGQMVAFMTPLIPDRFQPTPHQEIIEPTVESRVFNCRANAVANNNDRDRISENLRIHQNGINMKVLLAGNVPKFHVRPNEEALKRIGDGLRRTFDDRELRQRYYGEFIYHYQRKYKVEEYIATEVLRIYIERHLIKHMACRVGVENWPTKDIATWLTNYFGVKKLEYVLTEAQQIWFNFILSSRS